MRRKSSRVRERFGMLKWVLLCILILGGLGTSYAAYSNLLYHDYNIGTGLMGFIFDDYDDGRIVSVEYQKGPNGALKELEAAASYDEKKLTISEIGPLSLRDFMDGDLMLFIHYTIKTEEEENGMKRAAAILGEEDSGYYIGEVDFLWGTDTPVWNLENNGISWGTESADAGGTPTIIYSFLPKRLCQFDAYHTIEEAEEGMMTGTIILNQKTVPPVAETGKIGLSSLNLPEEVVDQIKSGSSASNLTIEGIYNFEIPINLDQFNIE